MWPSEGQHQLPAWRWGCAYTCMCKATSGLIYNYHYSLFSVCFSMSVCFYRHHFVFLSSIFLRSLRRDQKVPWSVCTLGTRRSSSRVGRWAPTSSWRGWRGTRRLSSDSANVPWATETVTLLRHRAPRPQPRVRFQQTWDLYVTRAASHVTLTHDDNQTEIGTLPTAVMHLPSVAGPCSAPDITKASLN